MSQAMATLSSVGQNDVHPAERLRISSKHPAERLHVRALEANKPGVWSWIPLLQLGDTFLQQ